MIFDLERYPGQEIDVSADIAIVGGGTAGLILACELAAVGRRVTVLESGGMRQIEGSDPLNDVVQLGDHYAGASEGRVRRLGGTSTRWGGAMIPFSEGDLAGIPRDWCAAWPIRLEELTRYVGKLEAMFSLPQGPYDAPEIMPAPSAGRSGFVPRLAKWPRFNRRNVATLLRSRIRSRMGPSIWLNATVTGVRLLPDGRAAALSARGDAGGRLDVSAAEMVIAAGAIESTRLLLLADRSHDQNIFARDEVLGHYFHDHLSAPTARLETTDKKALNRTAGFRFESRGMRSLRFEPSLELRRPENLPAGFAHIGYSTRETSGFEALRVCYRSIQQRGAPTGREVASLAPFIPWLARASWWRLVERRLLFPENPEFDLHMVVEQVPMFRNRIDLSQDRFDRFGAPLARIDWRIGDADVENARLLTAHFVAAWRTSRLASLGRCHTYSAEAIRRGMLAAGGIYHPGGTVRMAASPSRGVVDGTLRTFRIRNLSVLSTAVFPTGGGSNPTMMLLLAALRMAETLR